MPIIKVGRPFPQLEFYFGYVQSNIMKKKISKPIGKLLTGKGPIPGDLGAFGTVWGKISATGDQAERMMGFRPKEGAIGVLLSRRKYTDKNGKQKKGIFASSLMPRRLPETEGRKAVEERIKVVAHIVHKYHSDLIVPIWNPLIKDDTKKPYTGYHYFMSVNLKSVGVSLNWRKLLISKGTLKPPTKLIPNWYDPDTQEIKLFLTNSATLKLHNSQTQIGIGILDIITGSFFHIPPQPITDNRKPITEYTWKLENIRKNYNPPGPKSYKFHSRFYIYMYYRKHNSSFIPHNSSFTYSPSISSRIQTYKNKPASYPWHINHKRDQKILIIKIVGV